MDISKKDLDALAVVLDFVERWNKQGKETDVAQTAERLHNFYDEATDWVAEMEETLEEMNNQ